MMLKKIFVGAVIFSFLFISRSYAGTPQKINYQGNLQESGSPVDGSNTMIFKLFDAATAGNELWSSGEQAVNVSSGLFHHILGEDVSLSGIDWENNEVYLEITVDGTALSPREQFIAVPYAMNADKLDGMSLGQTGSNYVVYADTNGKVGIGTTLPGQRLDVNGNIRMNGWYLENQGTYMTFYHKEGGKYYFRKSANGLATDSPWTNLMTIDNSGNVGIGTSSPTAKLQVNGILSVSPGQNLSKVIIGAGTTGDITLETDNAGVFTINNGNVFGGTVLIKANDNLGVCIKDNGNVGIGTASPEEKLDVYGTLKTNKLSIYSPINPQIEIYESTTSVRYFIWGGYTGLSISKTSVSNENVQFKVHTNGNVGIGTVTPSYPLTMASGAYCSAGGIWTDASSRAYKENIEGLNTEEALSALAELNPVKFNYKVDKDDQCLGFIAEDVPEIVAVKDRQGLSPMDIVAVLTKVVQQQQKEINELKEIIKTKGLQ